MLIHICISRRGFLGVQLLPVMIHEIGHSIGIRHSDVQEAIMWPWITGITQLHQDDVNAVQTHYGELSCKILFQHISFFFIMH